MRIILATSVFHNQAGQGVVMAHQLPPGDMLEATLVDLERGQLPQQRLVLLRQFFRQRVVLQQTVLEDQLFQAEISILNI